jgi:hypothetical protein
MPSMTDLFTGSELKSGIKNKSLLQDSTGPVTNRVAASGVIRINYDFTPDLNGMPTYDYNKY